MNSSTLNPDLTSDHYQPDSSGSFGDTAVGLLGITSRHMALLAAWIATCGSLFFSEVLGWRPCVLCWYQRILMYPLALLLAIGIVRRDPRLHLYVLPFSIAGIGVSLYHYLLIKTDWLPPPACAVDIPCNVDYLDWFGVINIPFLALIAFVIITGMMFTFAWFQMAPVGDDAEAVSDDESGEAAAPHITTANLTAGMIVVGVIVAFLVGSTFA